MRATAWCQILALGALLAAGACAQERRVVYDPQALPSGPVGASIRYGHDIIVDTHRLMKGFVRADMSCAACHVDGGTKPRGGSFVGTYARFPQWNKRSRRVITLQDRLAECFLYSMNGKPPAYTSKAMIAMVAYVAWLSRGTPTGAAQAKSDRYVEPLPRRPANVPRGLVVYTKNCETCHRANGAGISGAFPPLWGPASFNDGAGMAHIDRMTGFVRYNMPQNAPGTLSLDDAYDVAAFVLSHKRPHFSRRTVIETPPRPAGFF